MGMRLDEKRQLNNEKRKTENRKWERNLPRITIEKAVKKLFEKWEC